MDIVVKIQFSQHRARKKPKMLKMVARTQVVSFAKVISRAVKQPAQ